MFLSLGILLASARILGEFVERLGYPAVLGEIVAGVLLGPTVLGTLAPEWQATLFPMEGPRFIVLGGLTSFAIVLFLLVAGMEVDLSSIWKQGRAALSVSLAGILVPFALGIFFALVIPSLLGREPEDHKWIFALFFATALSISALPVIAKTLIDLNLYRTDIGMLVMSAAVFDDLTGWIIFSVILGMIGAGAGNGLAIWQTILLTLLFAGGMLTAGRWLLDKVLPWIQAYTRWPGGVMGFSISLALFCAAFTEWIGIHAIFGAFLVGVAIGDSRHLREHTRTVIHHFVSAIFAPLFFASIGLKVNFLAHFDLQLTVIVLLIACAGKILGCTGGAWFGGLPKREAWAVGFAMNARGAMEIILGMLAFQYGLIRERMFVALVIMALVTSLIGGPAIQRILKRKKARRFVQFMKQKSFIANMTAVTRNEAIAELAKDLAASAGLNEAEIVKAVMEREEIIPTGIGDGVAIPHARIASLTTPIVALGMSEAGVDFDSPDGRPSHLIFMILAPEHDNGAQIEILADIAKTFKDPVTRSKAVNVNSYTEFLALLKADVVAA